MKFLEQIQSNQILDKLTNRKISSTLSANPAALASLELDSLLTDISNAQTSEELAVNNSPLVRFINKIIDEAIDKHASDIHFEPYEDRYRIRYRHDGVLHEVVNLPANVSERFSARLKIMAELNSSERRLPQDGRFKIQLATNHAIDLRINTCPTLFGEKIVLRILDPGITNFSIKSLGFTALQEQLFATAIKKPQGMILVTGPTGSGKTVTQYTALTLLNSPEVNISTVEDPVEIYLPGINQINVNRKTGLSFATVLRALLRQDPDIIMVGEIRDSETAEIAIKAAQTGHLVLSTLHTNSAAETLIRLMSMGITPFNLASSIKLVIAQRLVRRLCERCKYPVRFTEPMLLAEGFAQHELATLQLYDTEGCEYCFKGYKGQLGVYEVMAISPMLEQIMLANGNVVDINAAAISEGMMTLRQAGLTKVAAGLTSLEELNSTISL